jgi:hypothetical protein
MDIATLNVLQGIVRRESRSLLQYVSESFPFTTSADTEVAARIMQIAEEEQVAAVALANVLARRRHRLPPYLGPYPMTFTSINYVTWAYLVPLLVDYQKQGIVDLERDLTKIADVELAEEVEKILEMKRRHLQILIELGGKKPALAS